VRRLNAISILTLVLSIGALVITAVGTGSVRPADGASSEPSLPPSAPVVIDADGREAGALIDILGDGEVGVMTVGGDTTSKH
jgi:hypothetical protein